MKYDTKAIFHQLEEEMSAKRAEYLASGRLVVRELYTEFNTAFFLGVAPDLKRVLLLSGVEEITRAEVRQLPECRGIKPSKLRFDRLGSLSEQSLIMLRQTGTENSIFEAFVDDLCRRVCRSQPDQLVSTLKKTLQQWQDFFKKGGEGGLSEEQRRGLFGELFVLRRLLEHGFMADVVEYWKGPLREDVDFLFGLAGIEAKSTLSVGRPSVTISNERQLAPAVANPLFLVVLLLQLVSKEGETLPALVQELRLRMSEWPLSRELFNGLLLQYGYLDVHADRYQDERYQVRDLLCYQVREGFPRIDPDQLPAGVLNVRYEITLDQCSAHQVSLELAMAQVRGALADGR